MTAARIVLCRACAEPLHPIDTHRRTHPWPPCDPTANPQREWLAAGGYEQWRKQQAAS